MSSHLFEIVEHQIPCQHIREYPGALANEQEDVLHLAVKQYKPLSNPHPQPGDVTIIAAHANGFPKELYEPLWDDILSRSEKHGFRIRGIWIADVAQQGQSGVLNEQLLGNDPSWFDHPRDLLHLVNLKRDEIRRPIVGIGHSMGGNNLVNVAYIHPRLFTTLILIDPVIHVFSSTPPEAGPSPAKLSTHRRDVWPSREAVASSYKNSKFYQQWDPRVLERWIRYGLRDLPTPKYPGEERLYDKPRVTLTTTKDQEVFTFLRPNYEGLGYKNTTNRLTHPDVNPILGTTYPFYRAEPATTFFRLPELRPSVLYIFGGQSEMCTPQSMKLKMDTTGIGIGGSGGEKEGRVKSVVFDDVGHLIAMEAVERTADEATSWLGTELARWRDNERKFREAWSEKSLREKQTIDERWIQAMGPLPARRAPKTKL